MKKYSDFRIQPQAIQEMKNHIEIYFERNMPILQNIAKSKKRKTIYEDDVIEMLGVIDYNFGGENY
jgi:histone H3/H4